MHETQVWCSDVFRLSWAYWPKELMFIPHLSQKDRIICDGFTRYKMRRWWWHHETHARGVTRISLERQSGDKRVTNTPEITPGNGEITPRMRIWTFLLPASTWPVLCPQQGPLSNPGWREEKRLEALTSARSNSFSHAAKGPWKGFKMTLCAIFGQNSHCCETLSSFTEYSLRTLPGDRSDYKMKLPRKATWRFTQFQRHLSQESRWQSYPRVYQNKHL